MEIRIAKQTDIPELLRLLRQILQVHHEGRPDLFRPNAEKYSETELQDLLQDETRPIFVAEDENRIVGYIFCILRRFENDNIMTDVLTLYIDDLCVDETVRGKGIGKRLLAYARNYAKECGCYNLTLNVWTLNENAMQFYEKCGLHPQKIGMEAIL